MVLCREQRRTAPAPFTSGSDIHHAADYHDIWICRPHSFSRNGERAGNATMSGDEIQGAHHQGMILGQYIQGKLLVRPELIESAPAERARLSAD
jgi:hypothetical protein